jgi:hypothetical protein
VGQRGSRRPDYSFETKKHPVKKRGANTKTNVVLSYGFFVLAGEVVVIFAGFTVELVELAGFMVELDAVEFDVVVLAFETCAGVVATTGVDVLTGLLVVLFDAASPQAIPKALSPRTVESTITLFILFTDSYLSQRLLIY